MVTLNLKLYAAPVALLLMSLPLAAPKAYADPASTQQTFQARFAYNAAAPAAEIYADLAHAASMACTPPGPRQIALRKMDKQCAADLLEKAVQKIGRTDIAAIHEQPTPRG